MIPKKITEIGLSDIQELINLGVGESKIIEYKKELKISTDSDKKEFLADVSSFANTSGGDLILGIEASGGVPTAISSIATTDLDAQKLQLESIIRTGISPRISFTLHSVETGKPGEYVLIIRISESWNKPHRVTHSGSNRFYARNSAGKYELDVAELRQAFTLSDGVEKRIQDFKIDRLTALETEETFFPLTSKNLIVLHLLPIESFSTRVNLERDLLLSFEKETSLFRPMYASQWHSPTINLEGAISSSGTRGSAMHSYIQLFRNGSIEMVESSILDKADHQFIPYVLYEKEVVDGFKKGIEILKKVGINAPVLLSLSLTNINGFVMAENRSSGRIRREDPTPIKQKNLILPSVMLNDFDEPIEKILQPTFDLVWNACGLPKSENYDNGGNFLVTG